MRSNKPPFNLHRILGFGFRNTSLRQTIASPIPQILKLADYQRGILGWASGAERIERAECHLQKDALRSEGNMIATLPAPLTCCGPHCCDWSDGAVLCDWSTAYRMTGDLSTHRIDGIDCTLPIRAGVWWWNGLSGWSTRDWFASTTGAGPFHCYHWVCGNYKIASCFRRRTWADIMQMCYFVTFSRNTVRFLFLTTRLCDCEPNLFFW